MEGSDSIYFFWAVACANARGLAQNNKKTMSFTNSAQTWQPSEMYVDAHKNPGSNPGWQWITGELPHAIQLLVPQVMQPLVPHAIEPLTSHVF